MCKGAPSTRDAEERARRRRGREDHRRRGDAGVGGEARGERHRKTAVHRDAAASRVARRRAAASDVDGRSRRARRRAGGGRALTGPARDEETAYVVGIDLGTTHTALASVDLALAEGDEAAPSVMAVPQLVAQGSIEARALLPSFLYLPHAAEGAQSLPWDAGRTFVVGEHARARGNDAPLRVVSSAKSWLCHPTIDRRAAVLP